MNSNQLDDEIRKWALAESQNIVNKMLDGVKQKTPVKTGFARDSWVIANQISQLGDVGVINNDAPYIGWLEFGTDRMYPRYMVRDTILELQREYP